MNVTNFENSSDISIGGTSKMGEVTTTYEELVKRFGEPTFKKWNDDKETAEWNLEFCVLDDDEEHSEFVTATIYDWKTVSTPFGEYNWCIGGYNEDAVDAVYTTMNLWDESV
jgi:hypothetical protein